MARKYLNPAKPAASVSVSDDVLAEARGKLAEAAGRLQAAEASDPTLPGWDAAYDAALTAHRAAERRLSALEALRAAQTERGGQRAAAVKSAPLSAMAKSLSASRDLVSGAAAEHLRAAAALAKAVDSHNALVAEHRAAVASLGLQMRDDLVPEDATHAEGVFEHGGLLAGDVRWTPLPVGGLEAHALRQVFSGLGPYHAMRQIGRAWRPHEVEARPDGLRVPTLADVAAQPAAAAPRPAPARRLSIRDAARKEPA
jgi:hypothetical protein